MKYTIVIVGAGTAGTTVAARLKRSGAQDIAIIDPYDQHYYQPLWTLVGGGLAKVEDSARPRADVMPSGVAWIKGAATAVDPREKTLTLENGATVNYEYLVMAPGIQLDWTEVPGLDDALSTDALSSNYRYDLAPRTWDMIRDMRSGTAVFTMPSGPIKCAGAPQKIAYLAADYWRRQGCLNNIDIHMILPTPGMFGVPHFAAILRDVAQDRYGINVHFESEVTSVDSGARRVVVTHNPTGQKTPLTYDFCHATPPQSAPDWVRKSDLAAADNPGGYIEVNKHTLQHVRFPDIFALGDAGSTPNSKTGAAIRKQAPVVVENLKAHAQGKPLTGHYNGYASCPLTTSRKQLLLAEFDYDLHITPSNPLSWPDTTGEVTDHGLFKKRGLPALYWNFMLKGLV